MLLLYPIKVGTSVTTKEVTKGTGLGLSIAHSIIEQQHGKIRVESEAGKGSTFEVLFPVEG